MRPHRLVRLSRRNRWLWLVLILALMMLWSGFSWLVAKRYTTQMLDQSPWLGPQAHR